MSNCESCCHAKGCSATYFDPPEYWCELDRDEFCDDDVECEGYEEYDEYLEYCKDYDAKLRGFEKA